MHPISIKLKPVSGVETPANSRFCPPVPKTLEETGLNTLLVEDLIFKLLLSRGVLSGKEIAQTLCLPFSILEPVLLDLKTRLLVGHRSAASMGDFLYVLSEQGQQRAFVAQQACAYVGPAPVPFEAYLNSMTTQSIRQEQPGLEDLRHAFSDLLLNESIFEILGPAIHSGRGLFLYGEPGNGKTSIAERIPRCFSQSMFLPKVLLIEGQLVQLYDPQCHQACEDMINVSGTAAPANSLNTLKNTARSDRRWIEIHRPVVVVGGELTLDVLELQYNTLTKICEAPLQLKANGGVFLIDDFGRQRIHHTDLLNRWIIPLEKHIDFLTLPTGQKVQVPFDELIIFSTNLNPKDLVDDAFLRRIPYKINIDDPTEAEFKALFAFMCPRYGIDYDETMIDYLIQTHYRHKRPFRCCQARDILEQIVNTATYRRTPAVLSQEVLNQACQNYFAAMGNLSL